MKNAVIINHDEDLMKLLKRWLENRAADVKCTTKPEDVVPTLEDFKPDFVMIDVLQLNTAKKIKEISSVPIVLMTSNTPTPPSDYLK